MRRNYSAGAGELVSFRQFTMIFRSKGPEEKSELVAGFPPRSLLFLY